MTKLPFICTLALTVAFCTSCGHNQKEAKDISINYEIKDTVTYHGPTTMVRNVKKGRNGTLLVAASYGGVLRYDGDSFTNIASKIGSRRFWDVLEDRRGNVWFTSTDSGLYKYDGKTIHHFTTRDGIATGGVLPIYEDRAGTIWLGTGSGLSRYDGKSFQNFKMKGERNSNDINKIFQDRTGRLWIGTRGGTFVYDGKTFTPFTNEKGEAFSNVWAIGEDRKGNIWLGGVIIKDFKRSIYFVEPGLWRYDGSTVTKISERGAYSIIEDKQGNIWTTGGVNPPNRSVWALSRYDTRTLYDKNPAVIDVMSKQKMLCGILEADDGSIWFGSGSGVYRYGGKTVKKL